MLVPLVFRCVEIGLSLRRLVENHSAAGIDPWAGKGLLGGLRWHAKHGRGKILCRRLELERGAVSGRVSLFLRSAEAKPFVLPICSTISRLDVLIFFFIRLPLGGRRPLPLFISKKSVHFCAKSVLRPPIILTAQKLQKGPKWLVDHHCTPLQK